MVELSVIILLLNYNRFDDTVACIESLNKITYNNFKILLIDNNSTDKSYEKFIDRFTDLEVIQTGKNLGYTGGINFGFRIAIERKSDYILVLNNDTIVEPEFLKELVSGISNEENAAAIGGTILCEHDRKKIWYAPGKLVPWRGLAVHTNKDKNYNFSHSKVEETTFITGCMILFRTVFLTDVGLEDERFFMYLDDIELSARILRKYRLLYAPKAIIYHKVLEEKESPFKLYYSVRNRFLLINLAFTGIEKIVAKTYFFIIIHCKILIWLFTNKQFSVVARIGLKDYKRNNFYEGNGLRLLKSDNS